MKEKFNPAPRDLHAVSAKEATKADLKTSEDLRAGLIDTFPASDAVSAIQPKRSTADSEHRKN